MVKRVVIALAIVFLTVQWSQAALEVVIDSADDWYDAGLGSGDYRPIAGSDAVSAIGQIAILINWQNEGVDDTQNYDSTVGNFLSLVDTFIPMNQPVTQVVFGLGVNQSHDTDPVEMTQLDITIGDPPPALSFDDGESMQVFQYGSGQALAEALIQVNFGVDLREVNEIDPDTPFFIESTITGRNDGQEVLFLTNARAVPEPGALLFGGAVCAVIGLGVGGRRLKNTLFARG